ncbi:MAG: hypothetical protein LC725_03585 [Lentisphaerae bacterium]|nr:hypothetical protein [Lentisphaerota bacterium]
MDDPKPPDDSDGEVVDLQLERAVDVLKGILLFNARQTTDLPLLAGMDTTRP